MAAVLTSPMEVPLSPAGWSPVPSTSRTISVPKPRVLLPVGHGYYAHARRTVHRRTLDQDLDEQEAERLKNESSKANGLEIEDDLGVGDEPESRDLLALDAKEWKRQDHYAVLGLSKFRYAATPDQIKIAHRKKVLKHHPDKKAGEGDSDNDQFFKCIQKAMEILSNPEKRRQFDSVDPYYLQLEEDVDHNELSKLSKTPEGFFKAFRPTFEREAHFSKQTPVPLLGTLDDSKAQVEGFYNFWYNFDSWRSFEYLDKEVNEGSDSRDDKRYTEKKNRTERARRKKEDNTRLRSLVDLALTLDPRIKRIKLEEKEARDRKKSKGNINPLARKEDEERLRREAEAEAQASAKAEVEAAEAVARAEAKKAKQAAANAAKKARRVERAAANIMNAPPTSRD
ncbi:DnaJ domain-containing protein [Cantharellus anzutake]|uniref:DnaJ domain-containing protein n=1 Tax=Cantharellus anzutake TaxID=1750568 RepID=UPI0019051CBC|nr:DnaJ domain-containing protein [Cantharellus anzutake]KAF8318823.1 DnaJ domain-containing protein [Cantharellus anzutake]